jgi:hypothetical protein
MSMEELLTIALAASVPAAIAYVAWRNRSTRPITARLFIAAAICQFLLGGVNEAEQLLSVHDVFKIWLTPESDSMDLEIVVGDELQPGSLGWQRMIAWQITLSSFNIISWSLMAWAILMRPDDSQPSAVKS